MRDVYCEIAYTVSSSPSPDRTEEIASAIEDLLYMGAIRIKEGGNNAMLSPQLALVAANVADGVKEAQGDPMKLMYYSLLIYMNEHLKIPKSLTIAMGNDMEKHREDTESGSLVTTYVQVLAEIWSQNNNNNNNNKNKTPS